MEMESAVPTDPASTALTPNSAARTASATPAPASNAVVSTTPATATPNAHQPSLMGVPVELRLQIIRHATASTDEAYLHPIHSSMTVRINSGVRRAVRGLSLACLQLHDEVDDVFYQRYEFTFIPQPSISHNTIDCDIASFMRIVTYAVFDATYTPVRPELSLLQLIMGTLEPLSLDGTLRMRDIRYSYSLTSIRNAYVSCLLEHARWANEIGYLNGRIRQQL